MQATTTGRFAADASTTNIPWVDSPFLPKLLERSGLDPEMADLVRRFARDGYVIIDPQIPSSVIDGALRDLDGRFKPTSEPYYADEKRLQDGWNFSSNVRAIATARRVLDVLRVLYQREPIPFQTLNFRVGSEQRTHSDTIHFHSIPHLFMAGVWVALEDVDSGNGPLHYYPTSQSLPVYDMADLGVMAAAPTSIHENYWIYEEFVEELMEAKQLERHEIKVERGQALIWSANLFHGGSPIVQKTRTRLTQVTHYFFSDCLYYTPLLSDLGLGRISLRQIHNLATGEFVRHSYNGCFVANETEYPLQLEGKNLGATPRRLAPYVQPVRRLESLRAVKRAIRRLIDRTGR